MVSLELLCKCKSDSSWFSGSGKCVRHQKSEDQGHDEILLNRFEDSEDNETLVEQTVAALQVCLDTPLSF